MEIKLDVALRGMDLITCVNQSLDLLVTGVHPGHLVGVDESSIHPRITKRQTSTLMSTPTDNLQLPRVSQCMSAQWQKGHEYCIFQPLNPKLKNGMFIFTHVSVLIRYSTITLLYSVA